MQFEQHCIVITLGERPLHAKFICFKTAYKEFSSEVHNYSTCFFANFKASLSLMVNTYKNML